MLLGTGGLGLRSPLDCFLACEGKGVKALSGDADISPTPERLREDSVMLPNSLLGRLGSVDAILGAQFGIQWVGQGRPKP